MPSEVVVPETISEKISKTPSNYIPIVIICCGVAAICFISPIYLPLVDPASVSTYCIIAKTFIFSVNTALLSSAFGIFTSPSVLFIYYFNSEARAAEVAAIAAVAARKAAASPPKESPDIVIHNPLEQFDILNFLGVNNVVLWLIIILLFVFVFLYILCCKRFNYVFYYLNKLIYSFIKNLVISKIDDRSLSVRYIPIFYFLFIFLLISNLLSIIPFVYTITSLIVLPFFLSITFFGSSILVSIRKYKWVFFSGFLPSGVPNFIMPFLVLIEFVSYIMRIFSLAIRLFANMLSGHILIKILISVSWLLISSFFIIQSIFSFVLVVLISSILALEIIICLLQAYVFVSLSLMYLNEGLLFALH